MKRIFPVLLALVLCFTCLTAPVSAAETSSDSVLIDALAYQNESSFYYYPKDTSYSVRLAKPSTGNFSYVETFVHTNVSSLDGSYLISTRYPTTVIPCGMSSSGYYLYKLVWSGSAADNGFTINFNSTSTITFINILSFRYSVSPVVPVDLSGYCGIYTPYLSDSFTYDPTGSTNYYQWTPVADGTAINDYQLQLYAYDWESYDYLNFLLYVGVGSVTSVAAWDGIDTLTALPFEVNYLDNSSESATYYISVTVDIRAVDKSDGYPHVVITGDLRPGLLNSVRIDSITGWYISDEVSPVVYWLRKTYISLATWISDQTSAITTQLTQLKSSLSSWFSTMFTKLDTLISGSAEGQTNADNFNSSVDEQSGQLDEMQEAMDSVERPDIDSVDISVDQYISQTDVTALTAPLAVFLTGDIFGPMVFMVLIFATVSYVLFGKR